jgi:peptide chain release factor 1
VNKTESAVRITHLPTGIAVAIQDDRSQHRNRAKAMKIIRAKLLAIERQRIEDTTSANRRLLIGKGDRSERIRTYNYPQGRVTDHRVGLTLRDLTGIVSGDRLHVLLEELTMRSEVEELARLVAE